MIFKASDPDSLILSAVVYVRVNGSIVRSMPVPFVIAGVLIAAVTAEVSDCNSSSSTLPHTVQVCFLNPFSVSVGSFTITHSPYVCVAQALPSPSPSSQPTAKIAVIAITAEATNSHSFFNFVVMLDFSFLYIFFARGFPLVRSEPQKVALFRHRLRRKGAFLIYAFRRTRVRTRRTHRRLHIYYIMKQAAFVKRSRDIFLIFKNNLSSVRGITRLNFSRFCSVVLPQNGALPQFCK